MWNTWTTSTLIVFISSDMKTFVITGSQAPCVSKSAAHYTEERSVGGWRGNKTVAKLMKAACAFNLARSIALVVLQLKLDALGDLMLFVRKNMQVSSKPHGKRSAG